jgi:hypothetical protein
MMKTYLYPVIRFLFLIIIIFSSVFTVLAAPLVDIRVQIKVTDCVTGTPIEGATVRATTSDVKEEKSVAYTNGNGYASLYPIRPGDSSHTIKISAPYYLSKSVSQYMKANSVVNLQVCLDPLTPPSPIPPPTPIPLPTDTAAPLATLDPFQVVSGCTDFITQKIGAVLPLVGSAQDIAELVKATGKAAIITAECKENLQCTTLRMLQETAWIAAKLILKEALPPTKILFLLTDLLDPKGEQECVMISKFVMELVKDLAIQGLNLSATAVYSPATILITDQQGRRSGFMIDGSMIEEIPESKVVLSGEDKFVFIPTGSVAKVSIQGVGAGGMTLDMVHRVSNFVVDFSFSDITVGSQTKAELIFNGLKPELWLDTQGTGNPVKIDPGRLDVQPVQAELPATPALTPVPTFFTPTILPTQIPPTGAPPSPTFPIRLPCLGAGLVGLPFVFVYRQRRLGDSKRDDK